jgi:hypothetical protein
MATLLAAVYNKYLVDLIVQCKPDSPGLKRALRAGGHSAIDPDSAEHVSHAASTLPLRALVDELDPADALSDPRVLAFELLHGVPLSAFLPAKDADATRREVEGEGKEGKGEGEGGGAAHSSSSSSSSSSSQLTAFVFVMATLSATYAEEVRVGSGSGSGSGALANRVLSLLTRMPLQVDPDAGDQAGALDEASISAILDDDIVALLRKTAAARDATMEEGEEARDAAVGGLEDVMAALKDSKIADLATEITQEIDLSKLGDHLELKDLLDMNKLTDGNSVLGSIMGKVGSKLKDKLASGEFKQEQLMSEALGLLNAFQAGASKYNGGGGGSGGGGTNLLDSLMKSLGGDAPPGGSNADFASLLEQAQHASRHPGRPSFNDARSRMRKRLHEQNLSKSSGSGSGSGSGSKTGGSRAK